MTYATIADVRSANKNAGLHFFNADTMRFFRSRVESQLIGGRLFVTSEQAPDAPRRYTVRLAGDDGDIHSVGDFQEHATYKAALYAAKHYAEMLSTPPENS